MNEQTRKALELARDAIRDGLSVCQSVSMDRSRRVMRDDCVFYLQTEEWCKWVEDEVGALMRPSLAAIDAALSAPAAPVAQPVMVNGLTEAETAATASVAGLASQPVSEPSKAVQPLTDEQIMSLSVDCYQGGYVHPLVNFARAIERSHGIGQGGAA